MAKRLFCFKTKIHLRKLSKQNLLRVKIKINLTLQLNVDLTPVKEKGAPSAKLHSLVLALLSQRWPFLNSFSSQPCSFILAMHTS